MSKDIKQLLVLIQKVRAWPFAEAVSLMCDCNVFSISDCFCPCRCVPYVLKCQVNIWQQIQLHKYLTHDSVVKMNKCIETRVCMYCKYNEFRPREVYVCETRLVISKISSSAVSGNVCIIVYIKA